MLKQIFMGVVCLTGLNAQQLKEGEYEPYNLAIKDLNAGDFPKALQDLDMWKDKFTVSEFADTRTALYVQDYAGLNRPDKAIETARLLLAKDLKATFPSPNGQAMIIRLLYNTTWAISHIANPSPEDVEAGDKAAHQLMAYDEPLPGVNPEKWAEARADMKEKAAGALLYVAMLPGIQAMAKRPPDCAAAEAAYTKALGTYPDKAAIAYELGRAFNCETRLQAAIYEFQRASVIDATLGDPRNDAMKIRSFADNAYVKFHGSDEGLDQLKVQVKQSPLPPEGFTIRSADEIATQVQADWEKTNPQLALWKKIRDALASPDGAQFFETQLKDAAVPQLKGTLVEAKPACRPSQLFISVNAKPEIVLKLEKPLTGKPELNTEIEWEGFGSVFTREPFQVTMETSADKITGLKTTPCAATRRK